jgi:hypothetical protein
MVRHAIIDNGLVYTNSCNKSFENVKYRCFFLENHEQATAFGKILGKHIEGLLVKSKAVCVPLSALKKKEFFGKKNNDNNHQSEKTVIPLAGSQLLLKEFLETFRSEVYLEARLEFSEQIKKLEDDLIISQLEKEDLSGKVLVAERTLVEIQQNNYIINKNGTETIMFGTEEFGKRVRLETGGIIIDKTLFASNS